MQTASRRSARPGSRSESSADAIIVGAGHNGLVAANLLADAGWDVIVCEATPHIGGAVRSAEVTAPGYLSDLFSAFYPLSIASPVIAGLDLGAHGLQWTHSEHVLSHVFPDDRCSVLSRDIDVTAASLERFAAGDGDRWRSLVSDWEQIRPQLIDALFTPLPAIRPATRLLRTLGAAGALRFARQAVLPVRRFGEEVFSGEGAQMLLAGNALHADLPPEGAGSGLYGWVLCMIGQSYGFPVPVGGAGMLTQSMANRLASKGGSIRLEAPVESIDVVAGAAVGVRLEGGEYLAARRAVLADVPAPVLYRRLVGEGHLTERLLRDLDNFQWDSPTLKVDWALSSKIGWTAEGAHGAGTVHLGVDLDGLTHYAADLATKQVPDRPFVLLGQMTTADPSRSPADTESAWSYTHLPIGVDLTAEQISAQVTKVEQLVDKHAPGFIDSIVGRYIQSPQTLQQENPSLVHGAINGGTAQLHQQLIFRPLPGLGGASTPIDRLYLASSSAHPGGGVHGGPGSNAARAALSRQTLTGRGRHKAAQLAMNRIYR
jgi:phytoene dehydrogenase-like protein